MPDEKQPLESFADARAEARYAENAELARKNRALSSANGKVREELAGAHAEIDAIRRELALYRRNYDDRPKWLAPTKPGTGRAQLVAFLSDTHYGETIDLGEMDGYNKYDLAIAEERTRRFFERIVWMARHRLTGVKYDGIVLALGGDLVSGDIHDELEQTNARTTYNTTIWAAERLVAGAELLAETFGRVHVVSAPGNHGRDGKVPRYKGRSAHNADSHIARLMALLLAKRGDVTFTIPEALDATFSVYEWNFGLEHGDELMKNFSGSAEIGWLGPLIRGTNRKINAYAAEGKRLDYCLWGHGHQQLPMPARGALGNGSLCGYNEFARGRKFRPEPPQQLLLVVDPTLGVTLPVPIFTQDRRAERW